MWGVLLILEDKFYRHRYSTITLGNTALGLDPNLLPYKVKPLISARIFVNGNQRRLLSHFTLFFRLISTYNIQYVGGPSQTHATTLSAHDDDW